MASPAPVPPIERLHEIAQRRLRALGVPTRLAADGSTLEGELVGSVRNPLGGKPFERIRFVVEGHDKLRPVAPPAFEGLPATSFFDVQSAASLLAQLERRLQQRADGAHAAFAEMRRLRLGGELDMERIRAVGSMDLTSIGTVVIVADERGIRAERLLPATPGMPAVRFDLPLQLAEFPHRVDLELALSAPTEAALRAGVRQPEAAPARTPGPAGAGVTLAQLLEKFGPDARLAPGFVLVRDFVLGDQALRFVARQDETRGFTGRLLGKQGVLWDEAFELARLPRVEEIAAAKLGTVAPPALQFTLGPAAAASNDLFADDMRPVAGEVWVMSILVEQETDAELRYVPVDVDGKPFGAARSLPRADFLATFQPTGGVGYRLPAKVVQVSDTHVTWVQLDPRRQPVGQPKTGALGLFVHHFVPEAASY